MMEGWYLLSRRLNDPFHDLHPHSTGEAACSAWAWVDLIGMARWKDSGGVPRGQVPASERFLATRWNWHRSRVTRFLDELERKGRIEREPQTGRKPGHVVICNYDTYQTSGSTSEAASEPREGPRTGPREGPKKKEERKKKKESDGEGSDVVVDMWAVWLDELGGGGRKPKLTAKRKQKLRELFAEQLSDADDPVALFRRILHAVKRSDHHMSDRAYQMPESLFRNQERRDRWTTKAFPSANGNGKHNGHPVLPRTGLPERAKTGRHLTPEDIEEIRRQREIVQC